MAQKKTEQRLKTFDAYISMALGLAVVIIAGALIYNYTTKGKSQQPGTATGPTPTPTAEQKAASLPTTYTVQAGDNLWKISEEYYNSGYNWVDIAKANNLANPGDIHSGDKLTIPQAKPIEIGQPQGEITPTAAAVTKPAQKTYTVQHGDSLWKIAVTQYNDGYKWVDIAKANNLTNPNVIHAGNVLQLP